MNLLDDRAQNLPSFLLYIRTGRFGNCSDNHYAGRVSDIHVNSWPCSPKSYLHLVVKRPTGNREARVRIIKADSDFYFFVLSIVMYKIAERQRKNKTRLLYCIDLG